MAWYFGGERGFLQPPGGLGGVVAADAAGALGANPLALQIRVFRIIQGLAMDNGHAQRRDERDCADEASIEHGDPPGNLFGDAASRGKCGSSQKSVALTDGKPADGSGAAAEKSRTSARPAGSLRANDLPVPATYNIRPAFEKGGAAGRRSDSPFARVSRMARGKSAALHCCYRSG